MRTRFEIIQTVLTDIFGCSDADAINHKTSLADLGADSLDKVEFLMALEAEMDMPIEDPEAEALEYATVGEWLVKLDEWLGPEAPIDGLLTLTDAQFDRRYRPLPWDNGDLCRQFEWHDAADRPLIQLAIAEKRCWTLVSDDWGNPCIVWGNRVVNRIHNIITEKPIEDPDWEVQVPDEDADREGEEEEEDGAV